MQAVPAVPVAAAVAPTETVPPAAPTVKMEVEQAVQAVQAVPVAAPVAPAALVPPAAPAVKMEVEPSTEPMAAPPPAVHWDAPLGAWFRWAPGRPGWQPAPGESPGTQLYPHSLSPAGAHMRDTELKEIDAASRRNLGAAFTGAAPGSGSGSGCLELGLGAGLCCVSAM